ncbi:circadian clock KaiB family protein [Streptomyces marispadix]|uniref:KaiB domain-containing protein n=1 Tax=Streptomyces marispadix TaxID=2922868 RepID=A0ABS9T3P2_9ACTN|nr:circadian clock KaiB family protein [Streptomyces marispadix]MCH6163137.1 hypothetical protein [Streptomyces marispadix]
MFRAIGEVGQVTAGYAFCLYVAGQSERSSAAESNLRALAGARLPDGYEVEVVDVVARPGLAEEQRILATPTVVRLLPLPQVRVIGDLSDPPRVASALGLPDEPKDARMGKEAGDD